MEIQHIAHCLHDHSGLLLSEWHIVITYVCCESWFLGVGRHTNLTSKY